ncbi:MAG: hypothetical protein J5932_10055, partial [Prevotella sp.]|nr:hypothetical protein [Prevotella sp.]
RYHLFPYIEVHDFVPLDGFIATKRELARFCSALMRSYSLLSVNRNLQFFDSPKCSFFVPLNR